MLNWLKRKDKSPQTENVTVSQPDTVPESDWSEKLNQGLAKTSDKISDSVSALFHADTPRLFDAALAEELEEALILADMGPVTAANLVQLVKKGAFGKQISPLALRESLADIITDILTPVAVPLAIDRSDSDTKGAYVILVTGVNGVGKTTTIGKLASQFSKAGAHTMLAAGDTFRAAAVEQLSIWGQRTGCRVVKKEQGADAAALAFEALEIATEAGADILLMDTAGRLHNKTHLMDELRKIVRVMKKHTIAAPQKILLVLDATTGQNALDQVKIFGDMVEITGLIVTKLDGSAKGGILVALAERFGLPVHAIGVGEGVGDLRAFNPRDYARKLMGFKR